MPRYSQHVNNVIIRFSQPMAVWRKKIMSERFAKKWGEKEEQTQPIQSRLKEAVRPPGPLKPRLDFAIRRIELQVQRLDNAGERFTERDKSIFIRIVEAYSKHDMQRANDFANEPSEVRKIEKMIM